MSEKKLYNYRVKNQSILAGSKFQLFTQLHQLRANTYLFPIFPFETLNSSTQYSILHLSKIHETKEYNSIYDEDHG